MFTIIILTYVLAVLAFIFSWVSIHEYEYAGSEASVPVTVIIVARNEEATIGHLLQDISSQQFPMHLLEVIVADDFSEDGTEEVVKKYQSKVGYTLHLLKLPEEFKGKPNKKEAIRQAISRSKGRLIVTTDADCSVSEQWLCTLEEYFRVSDCKLVCGPVFFRASGLFERLQQLEFASLIGSGAATLHLGIPTMCNGANLAYWKDSFLEVGGFEGNMQVASGDDEFLMHKVYAQHPDKVKFLKSRQATVTTFPKATLRGFVHQRIRWASKWPAYKVATPRVIALLVFITNLSLLGAGIGVLFGVFSGVLFLEQFLVKILAEFVFLRSVQRFSGEKMNLGVFLILGFLYPFYVVSMAIAGLKGSYEWKGRRVK